MTSSTHLKSIHSWIALICTLAIFAAAITLPTTANAQENVPPTSAPTQNEESAASAPEVEPTPTLPPPFLEPDPALAQLPTAESGWMPPANLSRAGAAVDPAIFIDHQNNVHIMWIDLFDGLMYITRSNEVWSKPVRLSLPSHNKIPNVIVDSTGRFHAFWISDEGRLFHAQMTADNFINPTRWSTTRQIGNKVQAFTADMGTDDVIRLAILQTQDNGPRKAGVYLRSAQSDAETNWTSHLLIYASPYLRSITAESAHIDMAVALPNIYVSWDNPGRDWVMLAHSNDNGDNWDPARIVDGRQPLDSPESIPPRFLSINAIGDRLTASWQAEHGDVACGQYALTSNDAGESLSLPTLLFGDLFECPSESQLIPAQPGSFLILSRTSQSTIITTFADGTWAGRAVQPALTRFTEEDTLRLVEMGCFSSAVTGETLYVIGCDLGSGQDIWLSGQPLTDLLTNQSQDSLLPEISPTIAQPAPTPAPTAVSQTITAPTGQSLFSNSNLIVGLLLILGIIIATIGIVGIFRNRK